MHGLAVTYTQKSSNPRTDPYGTQHGPIVTGVGLHLVLFMRVAPKQIQFSMQMANRLNKFCKNNDLVLGNC